jgi:hypothetical protein
MRYARFRNPTLISAVHGGVRLFAACVLLAAPMMAGCAKAKASELVPDGPPLAMPAPPPRVLAPIEEVAVAAPATPTPAPEPAAAPRTGGTTPPRQPARTEPKQETPPVVTAPPPAAPPPTPTPTETREVRALPAAAAAAEDKKVRDVMTRASRDLNRVDYQKLSAEGKSQYDQSKRFSEQAEQALKEKNFVYAMTLAEKAATLAEELAPRR